MDFSSLRLKSICLEQSLKKIFQLYIIKLKLPENSAFLRSISISTFIPKTAIKTFYLCRETLSLFRIQAKQFYRVMIILDALYHVN